MADNKVTVVVEAEDRASDKLGRLENNIKNIDRFIKSMDSGLRQYNSAMAGVNRMMINLVKDAGAAIYDFTSDSIKNFSDLSEQHAKTMGTMSQNYDKTLEKQQLFMEHSEKLRQQAIDMAKYGVTVNGVTSNGSLANPVEISETQTALARAGIDAETMLNTDVVSNIVQFAKANDINTEQAVQFAVSLGSQFNIDYKDWGTMLDKVAHTADLAPINVSDVVQSMKYAGGITSGLDRSIDETLAQIAVLGNFGIRGSQAGSGIQALLTKILTGDTTVITKAQAEVAPPKALEAFYNFSNYAKSAGSDITYDDILNEKFTEQDITGNLRPMEDVLDAIDQQMSELNDEEQAWFAKKLFGLYQMKAAYGLLNGEGDNSLDEVIKEINQNSDGTNQNKYAEIINSQYGREQSLRNLIDGIKTEFGQMLEPTTVAVINEFTNFFKDPDNYQINWDNIRSALDESCDSIEEAYGSAIANAVRNLGNLTIDLGTVVEAAAPSFINGMAEVFGSLTSGNIFGKDGVKADWGEMITNMRTSLEGLPPNLQELGNQVVNVVDAFGKLAAINMATTIAQLITATLQFAMMTINAASVVVNGQPIYGTGTNTGTNTGNTNGGNNGNGGNTNSSTNTTNNAPNMTTPMTIAEAVKNGFWGNLTGILGAVTGGIFGNKIGDKVGDVLADILEGFGVDENIAEGTDTVVTTGGSIAGSIYGSKFAKWGLGKIVEQIATIKQIGLGTYASNLGMSVTEFLAANPALVNWLGVYGPAIPDVLNNTGEMIKYMSDSEYREYDNWQTGLFDQWGLREGEQTQLESMQKAINDGTYEDWINQHVSKYTHTNKTSGKLDGDFSLIYDLFSAMYGTKAPEYSTADELKNIFRNLNTDDIMKIIDINKLQQERYNIENNIQKDIRDGGNYYDKYDRNSPFYGSEKMFSYEIGEYTQDDLEKLMNTMIKNYIEDGSVNVGQYFGSYMYQGGDYAKQVNKIFTDLFGSDSGYSSNFFKEIFNDQNATASALNKWLNDILSKGDYTDKYNEIINGSKEVNTNDKQEELDNLLNTQYEELIKNVGELNTTLDKILNPPEQKPTIEFDPDWWKKNMPSLNRQQVPFDNPLIQKYLQDINISPQFTMEAPKINVNVTVDGTTGTVKSQNQQILNPNFNKSMNTWYQQIMSQQGGTTK